MLRAESGTIWPSHRSNEKLSTPGWKLHEGKGPRSFTQKITFSEPFDDPPKVFLALSGFDLIEEENIAISLRAENVTRKSMNIVFSTTHSSLVWSAAASYIAYGTREAEAPAKPSDGCSARIESGTYSFLNHPALSGGTGERSSSINVLFPHPFDAATSSPRPNVVACISGISARNGQKVKVNVRVSDVSNTSFRLTAATWGKSRLHSVTVSWIAYESSLSMRDPDGALMMSGLSKFNRSEPGYKLAASDSDDDDDDDDDADHVHHIMFPRKFNEKPRAVVCLAGFAIGKDEDYRIKTIERELNSTGFDLVLGTWCGTQVYEAAAAWIAFRQGRVLPLPTPPPAKVMKIDGFCGGVTAGVPFDTDDVSTEEEEEEEEEKDEEEKDEEDEKGKEDMKKSHSSGLHCVDVRDLPSDSKAADGGCSGDDGGVSADGGGLGDGSDVGSECKICFANKINTVIIPCGHLCVCDSCAKYLTGPKPTCPICRSAISKIIRAYLT